MFENWKLAREGYSRKHVLKYYIPYLGSRIRIFIIKKLYKIFKFNHKHLFKNYILMCDICQKSLIDIDCEKIEGKV